MSKAKPKQAATKPRTTKGRTKAQDTTGDEPLQRWSQGTGEEPDTRDPTAPDTSSLPNDAQPVQCAKNTKGRAEESQDQNTKPNAKQDSEANQPPDTSQTPLPEMSAETDRQGDDSLRSADSGGDMPAEWLELLNLARARDGETHKQCWERLRREARTAGMTRRDAISYAGRAVDHVWIAPVIPEPEPAPEPVIPDDPPPEPEEPEAIPEPETIIEADRPSADSLVFAPPESWGELPANASLQVEISWVSANRLRVRDGSGVDLSKALSPAPSYSALSWLETSILFPAKFADISVKATAQQDDEKELIRREKLAIEEVRSILKEMMED